jgi:hypothetical protein
MQCEQIATESYCKSKSTLAILYSTSDETMVKILKGALKH